MTTARLTRGLAALTLAGVAVLGMSASALAQTYPPAGTPGGGATAPGQGGTPPGQSATFNCPNPSGNTPGACPRGAAISPSAPAGTFTASSPVEVGVQSTYQKITTVTAAANGAASATFAIPTNLSNGLHHTIFTGTKDGQTVTHRVPFVVEGSVAGASRGRSLPRTGSEDLLALSLAGGTMVLVGAGVVVAARRRRDSEQFLAA